jgi:hypothetical protein
MVGPYCQELVFHQHMGGQAGLLHCFQKQLQIRCLEGGILGRKVIYRATGVPCPRRSESARLAAMRPAKGFVKDQVNLKPREPIWSACPWA